MGHWGHWGRWFFHRARIPSHANPAPAPDITHRPALSTNPNAATAYLTAHHYTQWWTYQPESRFWHFQLIEGGWLLALSLILLAATIWLVRRRAA